MHARVNSLVNTSKYEQLYITKQQKGNYYRKNPDVYLTITHKTVSSVLFHICVFQVKQNPLDPNPSAMSRHLENASKVACFTGNTMLRKQLSAIGNSMSPSLSNDTCNICDRTGNILLPVQKVHKSANSTPSIKCTVIEKSM